MNQLSEDRLSSLSDHLVAGPQTAHQVVMTRGRAIRSHRRQVGAGVVAIAAASVVTVVAATGVVWPDDQRDRAGQAASSTPADDRLSAASAALLAPCTPAEVPKEPTPEQVPDVLYLFDSAATRAISATLDSSPLLCNDASVAGADFSATGKLVRSFGITYTGIPSDPNFFPNHGLPHTRLRGHEASVAGVTAQWVENGAVWSWQSYGLSQQEMIRAIEGLKPDPARQGLLVPPSSFMDMVTVQDKSPIGSIWRVDYRTGSQRWNLYVENHWEADGPQFAIPSRLLKIAGHQVIVSPIDGSVDGKNNVGEAVFVDGHGRRFMIEGNLSDRQLREIIPRITKVTPDNPQVKQLFTK